MKRARRRFVLENGAVPNFSVGNGLSRPYVALVFYFVTFLLCHFPSPVSPSTCTNDVYKGQLAGNTQSPGEYRGSDLLGQGSTRMRTENDLKLKQHHRQRNTTKTATTTKALRVCKSNTTLCA